jgi:hypothetical protein
LYTIGYIKQTFIRELHVIHTYDKEMTQVNQTQHEQQPVKQNNSHSQTQQQQKLMSIKKSLEATIQEIRKLGGNTDPLETAMQETMKRIDNLTGIKMVEGLRTTFGNHNFKVTMENYSKPFLSQSSTKNDYRYILKNVSWTNGPNPHQVFFYIKEHFKYYLKNQDFDGSLFSRSLPGIEKRHISWFLPIPIAGKEFDSIEIFISKVYNKINEKTTMMNYIIDAVDPKLGLQNIRGETKQEAFERFQEALENIYYVPNVSSTENKQQYKDSLQQYKELMKKERRPELNIFNISASTASSPDLTGSAMDPDNDGDDDSKDPTDAHDVYDPDHDNDDDTNDPTDANDDSDEAEEEAKEDPAEEAGESSSEEAAEEATEDETDG